MGKTARHYQRREKKKKSPHLFHKKWSNKLTEIAYLNVHVENADDWRYWTDSWYTDDSDYYYYESRRNCSCETTYDIRFNHIRPSCKHIINNISPLVEEANNVQQLALHHVDPSIQINPMLYCNHKWLCNDILNLHLENMIQTCATTPCECDVRHHLEWETKEYLLRFKNEALLLCTHCQRQTFDGNVWMDVNRFYKAQSHYLQLVVTINNLYIDGCIHLDHSDLLLFLHNMFVMLSLTNTGLTWEDFVMTYYLQPMGLLERNRWFFSAINQTLRSLPYEIMFDSFVMQELTTHIVSDVCKHILRPFVVLHVFQLDETQRDELTCEY